MGGHYNRKYRTIVLSFMCVCLSVCLFVCLSVCGSMLGLRPSILF